MNPIPEPLFLLLLQTLNTTSIGRLVIYCDVVSSSMRVVAGNPPLVHGLVVIPTQQTHGQGKTVIIIIIS